MPDLQRFERPLEEKLADDAVLQVPSATQGKGIITVELRAFHCEELIHSDRVALASDLARRRFVKRVMSLIPGLDPSAVDGVLLKILNALEQINWNGSRPRAEGADVDVELTSPSEDGARLLDDVRAHYQRFIALPSEAAADALPLWTAHTHAMKAAVTSPYLRLESAEKSSGKSRTLEVAATLVRAPESWANASPAALFRLPRRSCSMRWIPSSDRGLTSMRTSGPC